MTHVTAELRDQLRGNLGLGNIGELFLRGNSCFEQNRDEEQRDQRGQEPHPDGFPGVRRTEAQGPCNQNMLQNRHQSGPSSGNPFLLSRTASYGAFQRTASQDESPDRVKGVLIDGFDSTAKSMRTLFPRARLGNCLRHAINKLPGKLTAIPSAVRKTLRSQFHTLLYRARQRKGLRVFALGQRLRRFTDYVVHSAGVANSERVRRWIQDKKAGWYAVLEDSQMPVTSTLLDQAHNAIERKLFAMKGFHHPKGSQQAFLRGLAHLYNLVPSQRRAQHAGQCGMEVEGGTVPTRDWLLNLQILTSGGFR